MTHSVATPTKPSGAPSSWKRRPCFPSRDMVQDRDGPSATKSSKGPKLQWTPQAHHLLLMKDRGPQPPHPCHLCTAMPLAKQSFLQPPLPHAPTLTAPMCDSDARSVSPARRQTTAQQMTLGHQGSPGGPGTSAVSAHSQSQLARRRMQQHL